MPRDGGDLELVPIPIAHLDAVWPLVLDDLENVASRSNGTVSVEGMAERFGDGRWQLVIVWGDGQVHATIGIEWHTAMTGKKLCSIRFATGRHASRWRHLLSVIEDIARMRGCEAVAMTARPGWAKWLTDYRRTHVLLEKAL